MSDVKANKPAESKDKPVIVQKPRSEILKEIISKHRQTRMKAGKQYSGKEIYTGK